MTDRLMKAVENLLPFIRENGMIGESGFELAVIELEKAYKAAKRKTLQKNQTIDHEKSLHRN